MTRIRPSSGSMDGGETITITGERYVNHTSLRVAFAKIDGEQTTSFVNATWVSDTEITAVVPPASVDGEVLVFVLFNETFYSKDSDGFAYLPRQAEVLAPGAIAGIAVSLAGAAAGLGVLLFVLKRKKVGVFSIELKEPDYLEIAFGSDRQRMLTSFLLCIPKVELNSPLQLNINSHLIVTKCWLLV